jgi:hypothetical protein
VRRTSKKIKASNLVAAPTSSALPIPQIQTPANHPFCKRCDSSFLRGVRLHNCPSWLSDKSLAGPYSQAILASTNNNPHTPSILSILNTRRNPNNRNT